MKDNLNTETLLGHSFKVINGLPDYINIEEKETMNDKKWKIELLNIIDFSISKQVKSIGVLINKSSKHYLEITEILRNNGFEQYASKVEVIKDLQDVNGNSTDFEWCSVANNTVSEEEFKMLWKQCISGSENRTSSLSIDEHLDSVKNLLGSNWRDSCIAIYEGNKPIGISIPHIEPGTVDEGRLFYFGLLPEERGKGKSGQIHYQSMWLLKQMGATYYKGSTHESNKVMQNVFLKNGCPITAHTESYYKYLTNK